VKWKTTKFHGDWTAVTNASESGSFGPRF